HPDALVASHLGNDDATGHPFAAIAPEETHLSRPPHAQPAALQVLAEGMTVAVAEVAATDNDFADTPALQIGQGSRCPPEQVAVDRTGRRQDHPVVKGETARLIRGLVAFEQAIVCGPAVRRGAIIQPLEGGSKAEPVEAPDEV